jgi:hypothetical protein
MSQVEALFGRHELSSVLQNQEQKAIKAIEALDSNRLLNTSLDDLVEYFNEEYRIEPLNLLTDHISVDQAEAKVDVSGDQSRMIYDRSESFYVDGTRVTFYLPYQGDKELFYCKPSTFNFHHPRAVIAKKEIQLVYEILNHDDKAVKSSFDGDLDNLKQHIGWIERDVNNFNGQLKQKIRQRVESRRQKILKDQDMVVSLGVPLRKREGTPVTYTAPVARKKINTLPPATPTAYKPEPVLETTEYEQILSIISNMVMVMERSPSAFHSMKEEDLRQHFLVQLNGQYEGQATGETFNYQGKTDILIRVNGKNIFIAECKFWKGEKVFLETINQLLGYTCWRDTKTAILVFNRNKKFSEVVKAIPEITKQHPSFKRQIPCDGETNSRYVFHHRDDPNRELIVTVMTFDIPGNE